MISREMVVKKFIEDTLYSSLKPYSEVDCVDNVIDFIDPPHKFKLVRSHLGEISSLSVSPNGNFLASGSVDRSIIVRYLPSLDILRPLLYHHGWVLSLSWDKESKYLISGGSDGSIYVWDVYLGEIVWELYYHGDSVNGLSWSQHRNVIASGSSDSKVYIFDFINGKILLNLSLPSKVLDVKWNPKREILAIAAMDGFVHLYNFIDNSLNRLPYKHGLGTKRVDWDRNGELLVSVGYDGKLIVWDFTSDRLTSKIELSRGYITDAKFSPNGEILAASTSTGEIKIILNGEVVETIQVLGKLNVLDWDKDSKKLFAGGADGNIYIVSI